MSRRATYDRPTPMSSLAQDIIDFLQGNPDRIWYAQEISDATGWPIQSCRIALGYLVTYRDECVRVAPGAFTWRKA